MAENVPTPPYRTPTPEEMAAILAKAKKLRSETLFALRVRMVARIRGAVRSALVRLPGSLCEPVEPVNHVTQRNATS